MAIITLARQVAAKGDEVAQDLAAKLNYKFITRKQIEERIIELGFPQSKMPKYDERKPGFFASMAKDRDAYQNLSQYAMLEAASKGNIIIIGRGAFALFREIPNHISVRLIASEKVRVARLMQEFDWTEKQARQHIQESDANRNGFHKNFYNIDIEDPSNFHMLLNTGTVAINDCANIIADFTRAHITPTKETEGTKLIEEMVKPLRGWYRRLVPARTKDRRSFLFLGHVRKFQPTCRPVFLPNRPLGRSNSPHFQTNRRQS